jgi:hypothetical protein
MTILAITNAGGTTDQPNQTISVTGATPGATVEIVDNGSGTVGIATANSSGACFVGVALAGGSNSLVATDVTTGLSSSPVAFTFTPMTITVTPPSGPVGSVVAIAISGATPGATVEVFDNGLQVGSAIVADANGNCATHTSALPAGTNNLVATDETTGASSSPVVFTADPGPTVRDTTTAGEKIAHGASTPIGTVVPGLPGDTLTLTQMSGFAAGTVTLSGGAINFAPAIASGTAAFSYKIRDQLGDVSAVIPDTLVVDPGPTAGNAHLYLSPGQSTNLTSFLLALDTPGLPGDALTLSAVGTAGTRGTVSLSNGNLSYTAPASGSSDAFTYTVSDQLHETAIGSVSVSLLGTSGSTALTGSGNSVVAGDGGYSITGGAGGNSISLGNGSDSVSLSGNNNTVVLGGGNDSVSLLGNNNTAILGNGNDSVKAGTNSKFTLGNGNDTIYAGAGDTITLGNGHDTVYAGPGDTITLGSGNDLLLFGVKQSPSIMDTEIVNGFNPKNDIIEFNRALFASFTTVLADAKQVGLELVWTR